MVFLAGTGGAEEFVRITNDGDFGIGTTSPDRLLELERGSGEEYVRLTNTQADSWAGYEAQNDAQGWTFGVGNDDKFYIVGALGFGAAATRYLTIDTSGQVGIGNTSPTAELTVDSSDGGIAQTVRKNTGFSFVTNSFLGGLEIGGTDSDSGTDNNAVGIYGYADGTWTNSSHPTHIRLSTTTSGSTSSSEKVRITNDGKVGINDNSPDHRLQVTDTTAQGGGILGLQVDTSGTTDNLGRIWFGNTTDASLAGILTTGLSKISPSLPT